MDDLINVFMILGFLRPVLGLCAPLRRAVGAPAMLSFEAVAGALAVALAVYLLLALLNPERFQ